MEVRLKIGRYAGEVRDVAAEIAREMIVDGRAEDPRFDELRVPQANAEVSIPQPRARRSRRS